MMMMLMMMIVEFYLYPTVSTALIYFLKPELNKQDQIEYGVRSNWVILRCMATIGRIVAYKIFINKQVKHTNVTIRLALYIFCNTVQSRLDSSQ